ncbi:30S ribosomal protein S27 [Nanohaloarchaea archaeon SG9]|nr:30S ribosomal protein S27 [Nanohaloarchaea archaeon SG9]
MARNFYKAKCNECGNEQVIFSRASTSVECLVCGTVIAKPTGGQAELNAEIIEHLEVE